MSKSPPRDPGKDPAFFGGRLLIEIEDWDASLFIGRSPAADREHLFQGGLIYTQSF